MNKLDVVLKLLWLRVMTGSGAEPQTKLKLKCGDRYALVGQNGTGKTTLMTAIYYGKLEGWPFTAIETGQEASIWSDQH